MQIDGLTATPLHVPRGYLRVVKADDAKAQHSLELLLTGPEHVLAGSAEVRVLAGGQGRLSLEESQARLQIALPTLSLAEQRFVVDQALRSLGGIVNVGDISLAGSEVSDECLLTIGLDLYHRSKGRLRMPKHAALFERVQRIGKSEDLYRSWVNEDPSTRTSIAISRDVQNWALDHKDVQVEVLDETMCKELGLNLLCAVGGASDSSPPRLVLASYRPKGVKSAPLAIVGKGITFDTGGINVKPYASFVSMMKNDMGGAALAVSLFTALVEAEHPEPLLLVVPTCENAVGERAMRPGALVKSYAGKTVRIDHTDAEGRLILADGIAYAGSKYQPRGYLCFATLTTSALNSYGPYATPVHFAEPAFESDLASAGQAMGEDFHFFPKRLWHTLANSDQEADLRNTARLPGNASAGAGSRNAAHFLLEFANAPLCHLDIFATTWNWSGEAPGAGYGATGAPLRSLLAAFGL